MTFKDIAKQLTTAVQTVPNLVQILRDGFEQAEAGSGSSIEYSTTEKVIGKWIDGKAIYQKTALVENISISSNSDANVNISDYFTGLSKLLSAEIISNDGNIIPAINVSSSLSAYSIGVSYDVTSDHIVFSRGSGSNITISVYITLRYTKSE